jgi:hypothetical protein
MPGVAEGKKLIGVPTGNETPMERVNALFEGSMSKEMYQVSDARSSAFYVFLFLGGLKGNIVMQQISVFTSWLFSSFISPPPNPSFRLSFCPSLTIISRAGAPLSSAKTSHWSLPPPTPEALSFPSSSNPSNVIV